MLSEWSAPTNAREAWAQERAEIPAEIAALQRDRDATPPGQIARRERLAWKIRRYQLRMAMLDARLAREDSAPS
jgi:hypothetical protein